MGKRSDGGERLTEVDLLIEVLSRLLVKSLLRCKAVSKSWYALISSPGFIRSHFQRTLTNGTVEDDGENNLIVHLYRNENRLINKIEDGSFSLFNLGSGQLVTNLKFPYPQGKYHVDPPSLLVGFVCGIACVFVVDPDYCNKYYCNKFWLPNANIQSNIYLWNPAIKQSKLIPPHTIYEDNILVTLGFGFDPIDFDFKVVRVVRNFLTPISPEVYSANRDTWRNIDVNLTDIPQSSTFEACLHGFLITIGCNGMMAFDLNKEVFVCNIKLPVNIYDDARISCVESIMDFKNSIGILIAEYQGPDCRITLWTLDNEACLLGGGVEASWTCMLSFGLGMQFSNVRGLLNNADLLLLSRDWFLFNLDKNMSRYISTNPRINFEENFFKYTESLISFSGSKLVKWSAKEDDNDESNVDPKDGNEESSVDSVDDEEISYSCEDDDDSNVDSGDGKQC